MCEDRQRLLEDRKAVRDAIKRALAANDDDEVKRLEGNLNWLDDKLKGENK